MEAENPNDQNLEAIVNNEDSPFHEKNVEDKLKNPFYWPVAGVFRGLGDTFGSVSMLSKGKGLFSSIANFLKFDLGGAIGYYATVLPHEFIHYGAALLTNVSLGPFTWFPHPGALAGYELLGGSALGITATALAPYIMTPLGAYGMIKGLSSGSALMTGLGAGLAYAPFANIAGDYMAASYSLLSYVAPFLGTVAASLLTVGLAASLVGVTYLASKAIAKKIALPVKVAEPHAAPNAEPHALPHAA